jgi:hypothetical protein
MFIYLCGFISQYCSTAHKEVLQPADMDEYNCTICLHIRLNVIKDIMEWVVDGSEEEGFVGAWHGWDGKEHSFHYNRAHHAQLHYLGAFFFSIMTYCKGTLQH